MKNLKIIYLDLKKSTFLKRTPSSAAFKKAQTRVSKIAIKIEKLIDDLVVSIVQYPLFLFQKKHSTELYFSKFNYASKALPLYDLFR